MEDDDIFEETPEYDQYEQHEEDCLRRSEEQAKMFNKPILYDMLQAVEEAEEPKPNDVKKGPKPPRVYKKGKEAPANNPNYDDNEIWKLYVEGKGYREIARILNIKSHNTVRNRIKKIIFDER